MDINGYNKIRIGLWEERLLSNIKLGFGEELRIMVEWVSSCSFEEVSGVFER